MYLRHVSATAKLRAKGDDAGDPGSFVAVSFSILA
jgi:hypothetical protein